MCGICGYIGENVKEVLLEKLTMLEYRGYDSCGIAFIDDKKLLKVVKSTEKIDNLREKLEDVEIKNIGIAHTRWATHGGATIENAHPHLSPSGKWAVVHNGIIENYNDLKQKYLSNDHFTSKTDTEVISHLLDKNENNIYSFMVTCNMLKGSYALCCINNQNNDMYLAKLKSPLYVGISKNGVLCASDTYCFDVNYNSYYELNDYEFALCKKEKIIFYNKNGKVIQKQPIKNKIIEYISVKKFDYYMEKEIREIPYCIDNLIDYYSLNGCPNFNFDMKSIDNIKLIGCGSAYHTALIGEKYFKKEFPDIETNSYIASEFRYSKNKITNNTLCIFISQSGETADTIACLDIVKNKCKTIAIVNSQNSTLRYKCKNSIFMHCGKEVAVATTKAFVNGVIVLYILSKILKNKNFCVLKRNLTKLKNNISRIIKNNEINQEIEKISNELVYKNDCYFIGRDIDYPLQMEAGLKLKEISYINCLSIPSGELKHGSLALIDKNSIIFCSITQKRLLEKNISNIKEIEARNGKVYVLSTVKTEHKNTIKFNHINDDLDVLQLVVFYQILAFKVCIKKGLSPDKPRNLAKSVTVE